MLVHFAEVFVGIQRFVAKKFEDAPVISVGSALGHNIHIRPSVASIRGVVLSGLDFKFLDSVGIGNSDSAAEIPASLKIVNFNTVHLEIVIHGSAAIGHKRFFAVASSSTAESGSVRHISRDSRRKTDDLGIVAGYQRETLCHFPCRHGSQRARFRL